MSLSQMSEHPGRDDFIDTGEAEPDSITDFTFTPIAFTAGFTGFALSGDPEGKTLTTWPEFIDYTWRKVQSCPPREKTNLFVGYSSLATYSRQIFLNSGGREHLDQAITWATEAEEFGRDVNVECKALWPALLAELLLQRFEHGQMRKDLEESCHQFRAYLHVFDHDAVARGAYADRVCRKLDESMNQMLMTTLLDESLVFAQIAEDAPYKDKNQLAYRLRMHGIFLFMKSIRHSKPETLKMALSKLEQAISIGLSEAEQATAKFLIITLRIRLNGVLPDFEIPPGSLDDLPFGNSIFSQVRKIEFALHVWEIGVKAPRDKQYVTENFLVKAEELTKEVLENGETAQYGVFEPEILVLAGQVSEACQDAFDGERGPELEDPAYYWARCWNLKHGLLRFRLRAIHRLSCRLFRQGKYEAAWARFQLARALIPIVCPQQSQLEDKAYLLQSLGEMSIDACATALVLGEVDAALEVLEEGRGLLLGHFDKSSKDLERLERQQIALFHKFESIRTSVLYGSASPPSSLWTEEKEFDESPQPSVDGDAGSDKSEEQLQPLLDDDARSEETEEPQSVSDDDMTLEEREESPPLLDPMGQVVKEIRSLSGFEDFLVPLTAKEIRGAAQTHSVVVLVGSILHQDAIILSRDKVDHVDLREAVDPEHFIAPEELRVLSREVMSAIIGDWNDFPVRNNYLLKVLHRLWKGVAEPISNKLGFEEINKFSTALEALLHSTKKHVIWMRTGDFHRLPINMALDGLSKPPTPFFAYATSSFTSSFRALVATRSRQQTFKKGELPGSMISMPPRSQSSSDGEQDTDTRSSRSHGLWIRNANEECLRVQKASPKIKWGVLERPSPQMVQEHSLESHFLHLVCHGVSLPNSPMQSYLQLWDRSTGDKGRPARLTISQLAQWTTTSTRLAFLSSCSTADAVAPTLYEENVDVCNALNLAGICDVVGSMWPIPDKVGVAVAEVFWNFFNDFMPDGKDYDSRLVAMALNIALIMAGMENPTEPLSWAGFIHVGGKFLQTSE